MNTVPMYDLFIDRLSDNLGVPSPQGELRERVTVLLKANWERMHDEMMRGQHDTGAGQVIVDMLAPDGALKHPWTPIADLTDAELDAARAKANDDLQAKEALR